ncbi:MAG: magnesium/cobalt transporter CorA [Anaerolineales bacterium]|nr:magnesium/cobalt transporter CorA [Anaerolineales bacterium]
MIRCLYLKPGEGLRVGLSRDEIEAAVQAADGVLWVDIIDAQQKETEPLLLDIFGFHPLAVDDALYEDHVPKVDDWGTYIYLALHAAAEQVPGEELAETIELDVFLGKQYLVTYHPVSIKALERLWVACQRDPRYLEKGVDNLLYHVTDEMADDYMQLIDEIDDEMEDVEDQIFVEPKPASLEEIIRIKRMLLGMRRIIAPQREVLNKLARGDYAMIGASERIFFRDVYDHYVRIHDIIESLRDLISSTLDMYLSVVNNRMNDVMKTLTVITTLFMPISFLTGFFGMNFFQPAFASAGWTDKLVFYGVLFIMVTLPMVMLLWMRRRSWM